MFTDTDQKEYDKALDYFRKMGENIGSKIHKSGSWMLKTVVFGGLILFFGGLVFIGSLIRKAVGKK